MINYQEHVRSALSNLVQKAKVLICVRETSCTNIAVDVNLTYASLSHLDRLLWTSDLPVAETSTSQHTTLTRQTNTPLGGVEPAIQASERTLTLALDIAATVIGN